MKGFQRITAPLVQKSAVALGFFDGVHLGHRAVLGGSCPLCGRTGTAGVCIYLCGRFRSGKTGRAAVLSLYRYPESGIDAGLRDPWGILSGIFGTVRTERRGILPAGAGGTAPCTGGILRRRFPLWCKSSVEYRQPAGIRQPVRVRRASGRTGALRRRENFLHRDPAGGPCRKAGTGSEPAGRALSRQRQSYPRGSTGANQGSPDDQHSLCSRTAGAAVWRVCFTDAHPAGQLRFHYGYWSQAHCQRSTAAGGQKRFCCTFPATCTNSPVGWNCCIFCGTSRNSPMWTACTGRSHRIRNSVRNG